VLRHLQARGAQRAREPDEWQADESGRILTLDALEERDAGAFSLESPRAVKRAFALDVALDLIMSERAQQHRGRVHVRQAYPGIDAHHGARSVEVRRAATQQCELLAAALCIAGLVELPLTGLCHLVAANDYGIGVCTGHRLRFFIREAQRPIRGGFTTYPTLRNPRGQCFKRQPQPQEQLAPVRGRRREDQGRLHAGKQWLSPKSDFDLDRVATYYTRPMSPPWSSPLEVDRLADGGADVDFAVPLAELTGLRTLPASVGGQVGGRAHFARQQGIAVAELTMKGTAVLECQRCMRPLEIPIDTRVRVGLVGSEAQAGEVPPDLEAMLAPGGRIRIGEIVTEELLLTLPIVPLHEEGDECAAALSPSAADSGHTGETHKPFARLGDLLKR
jgi:uncharacterized protein